MNTRFSPPSSPTVDPIRPSPLSLTPDDFAYPKSPRYVLDISDIDPSWGQRLDHALYARNVRKLYAFAVEIGVDESALSRWRAGKSISLNNAIAVCKALNISMDWLILGKGQMEVASSTPQVPDAVDATSQNRIKALETALKSLLLTAEG